MNLISSSSFEYGCPVFIQTKKKILDVQPKKKKKITQKRKNIPTKINDVFFSHKIRKYIKVLGNGNDVVSCLLYKRKSNQDFITTYLPVSNLLDSYHI